MRSTWASRTCVCEDAAISAWSAFRANPLHTTSKHTHPANTPATEPLVQSTGLLEQPIEPNSCERFGGPDIAVSRAMSLSQDV